MTELDNLHCPSDAEFLYDPLTEVGRIRRGNLQRYLSLVAAGPPPFMLLGEAPGYRGSTVTGVPLMSAREVAARPGLLTGNPAGDGFLVPPTTTPGWESTSGAVWRALAERRGPAPLMWSTYPHHPFLKDDPATNRRPRPEESRAGIRIALLLADLFSIDSFVAMGRVAERALAGHNRTARAVRHPAQGGARIFADQMREILHP
ncbi:MAG TPA: uracil-DNA glycosylase [Glaciibacter sp.]|nr:uracil-DNA glycosylase [Glaciibacter sp.]